MAILDLQRRLREAGRIRLGEQVATANGKRRPAKIETFRITSQNEQAIKAIAHLYGGECRPWADAPVGPQWEVLTEANAIPVVVPPSAMAFSQFYELWSGGGCVRRCDGLNELLSDEACLCDPEARECKATTRLSVILHELEGMGTWRVETHSYYAASELAAIVDVIQMAGQAGRLLPATLRLEQRQVKRIVKGKPVTLNFAVVGLDVGMTPTELGATARGALGVATASQPLEVDGWRPVDQTALPAAPEPSVAAAVDAPAPARKARSNAAEPLRSTGLKPRTRQEIAATPPTSPVVVEAAVEEGPPVTPTPAPLLTIVPDDVPDGTGFAHLLTIAHADGTVEDLPDDVSLRREPWKRVVIRCSKLGLTDDQRHQLCRSVTGTTDSTKDLNGKEIDLMLSALERIAVGSLTIDDAVDYGKGAPAGQALVQLAREASEDDQQALAAWFKAERIVWPLTAAQAGRVREQVHPTGAGMIVGIDPGMKGAVALVHESGDLIAVVDMPVVDKTVNAALLVEMLSNLNECRSPVVVVVEQQQAYPRQGLSSAFKTGQGYGTILGVVAGLGLRVEVVTASSWKRRLGLTSDKERSRAMALERWPTQAHLFKRKLDEGRAEAALLALSHIGG